MKRLISLLGIVATLCLIDSVAWATVGPNPCTGAWGTWQVVQVGGSCPGNCGQYTITHSAIDNTEIDGTWENTITGDGTASCVMQWSQGVYTGNSSSGYYSISMSVQSGGSTCALDGWNTTAGTIYHLTVDGAGCSAIAATNQDGSTPSGPAGWFYTRTATEMPGTSQVKGSGANGENTSHSDGWTVSPPEIYNSFSALLNDSHDQYFNFSGRTIEEALSGNLVGCGGSIGAQPGPDWYPDLENYSVGPEVNPQTYDGHGDDNFGLLLDIVFAIQRDYGVVLPCTLANTQTMKIDWSDGSFQPYQSNAVGMTVGDGTFTVKRNTTSSTVIEVGIKRSGWEWIDEVTEPYFPIHHIY